LRRAFEPEAGEDDLSPAALLAVATVSGAFAEARAIQTEFLYGAPDVVPAYAQPQEATPVDNMHNPFAKNPELADRYLRRLGPKDHVEHLILHQRNTRRPRWENYVSYAKARAFEAARKAAREEADRQRLPGVTIFGKVDRRNLQDQGQAIAACRRGRTPFVLVDPISGPDSFLAVHGDTLWASAAIAAFSLEDIATAVISGPAIAVTSRSCGLISLNASQWIPITETSHTPELMGSNLILPGGAAPRPSFQLVTPPEMDAFNWLSGNAMILNAVVLGGIGAGFQPSCYPWDACVVPVAAAAGRTVARVDTQECLNAEQLHGLLLDTLSQAERLPGMVIARHEVAAKRLVRKVRKYPA
jgi:hypothetical protein